MSAVYHSTNYTLSKLFTLIIKHFSLSVKYFPENAAEEEEGAIL